MISGHRRGRGRPTAHQRGRPTGCAIRSSRPGRAGGQPPAQYDSTVCLGALVASAVPCPVAGPAGHPVPRTASGLVPGRREDEPPLPLPRARGTSSTLWPTSPFLSSGDPESDFPTLGLPVPHSLLEGAGHLCRGGAEPRRSRRRPLCCLPLPRPRGQRLQIVAPAQPRRSARTSVLREG